MLQATLPCRWRPYSAPGVAVIARPMNDGGWFRTNLLLARDHLPPDAELDQVADQAVRRLADMGTDIELVGRDHGREGEFERLVQVVHFESRRPVVRVAQVQAFVMKRAPDEDVAEVAQFVGTCRFDELDRYGDDFARVVRSITFD